MLGQPRGIVAHGVMSWIVLEAMNQNDCRPAIVRSSAAPATAPQRRRSVDRCGPPQELV